MLYQVHILNTCNESKTINFAGVRPTIPNFMLTERWPTKKSKNSRLRSFVSDSSDLYFREVPALPKMSLSPDFVLNNSLSTP